MGGGNSVCVCVCQQKKQMNQSPVPSLLLSHCVISYHRNCVVRDYIQFVRKTFWIPATTDLRYGTCKSLKGVWWGGGFFFSFFRIKHQESEEILNYLCQIHPQLKIRVIKVSKSVV